ncbi:hypothetical protein BSKO_09393 [Bryopsis sp. KO-2023]|nr:hypothetical protein BSKO_09393 [Bryopsis sp. KO-2023]
MHSQLVASCSLTLPGHSRSSRGAAASCPSIKSVRSVRGMGVVSKAYKVEIEHQGKVTSMEVDEDTTILEAAEENGLELPHDCRLGVCMTCPARLVEGNVDQSGSMLSEDVSEKGYALLCVSRPESDCKFKTIAEEEVLDLQLMTSQF